VEFEEHLERCPVCQSEVKAFRKITGELAYLAPPVRPAPRLKQELMRKLAFEHVLVRGDASEWQKTPFPGVELKDLFVDQVTGAVTSLLRAAAGAIYPAHRHGGLEQIYIIDGDMIFDDHTLDTGDYEASAGSSYHSAITTRTGCLALIIHNKADRILRS
jgi:anti-sigma factor ChrR (cupin superfamily)